MIGRKIKKLLATFILINGLWSCDPWFAYSPYEAQLDKVYYATTEKNLEAINATDAGDSKPFKVALLSDTHYHYGKLRDAIAYINGKGDYNFAIVTGDISENGLKQEFIYFYNIMAMLNIPYLTVIGNHDYLANGEKIYSQMFGAFNYTFLYNNIKFVLFDNTTYESGKEPDMQWLDAQLANEHGYDHVIPLAHVPPYDGQMKDHDQAYHGLMLKHGISMSIHGHTHNFSVEEAYGGGVRYVTVSSPQKRTFAELLISPDALEVGKVEF